MMTTPLELLLSACWFYSIDNVQTLVAKCEALGVDINDTSDEPVLIRACETGDLEIIEYLLQSGANVHSRGPYGFTALHWAVSKKNVALVDLLLAHGADVMAGSDRNETPAHFAICSSSKEVGPAMLRALVDAGLDIHMVRDTGWGNEGYTLLHHACHHNSPAAAKLLLELGVDVNARNARGRTALYIAAVQDFVKPEIVELLLQHGADTTKRFSGGKMTLQLHIEETPNVAVMQLLMDHGLDLAEAIQREPPLHRILENLGDLNSPGLDVYQFFVAKGVSINGQNDKGQTPLHVACSSDDFLIVHYSRFLLERGAKDSLCIQDANGFLPLHCALKTVPPLGRSWSVQPECIALLLENGADPNAKTRDGRSALHLLLEIPAADDAREQCVRLLCSHGAVWDDSCERRLELMRRLMENPQSEDGIVGDNDENDEIVASARRAVHKWRFQVEAMTTSESQSPVLMLSGLRRCIQFWSEERSHGRDDVVLSNIPREVYYNGEQQVTTWLELQGLSMAMPSFKRRKM